MLRLYRGLDRSHVVLLHEFVKKEPMDPHIHNHPWSFAARILDGCYLMGTGSNRDRLDSLWRINAGDQYFIDPTQYHFVYPVAARTLSIVVKPRGATAIAQGPTASIQLEDDLAKGRLLDVFERHFDKTAAHVMAGAVG